MSRLVRFRVHGEGHQLGTTVRLPDSEAADVIARGVAIGITPVRLLDHYRLNNKSETCGFPDAEAAAIIEDGIAEPIEEPAVPEEKALERSPADRMIARSPVTKEATS